MSKSIHLLPIRSGRLKRGLLAMGIFLTLQALIAPYRFIDPMYMLRIFILLSFFCLVQAAGAQSVLSRVTFPIDETQTRSDLAKAGITGLNKLLGWEMSLQKNTDESGDIKSYYFSSRLLKFKAPVKKSANNL